MVEGCDYCFDIVIFRVCGDASAGGVFCGNGRAGRATTRHGGVGGQWADGRRPQGVRFGPGGWAGGEIGGAGCSRGGRAGLGRDGDWRYGRGSGGWWCGWGRMSGCWRAGGRWAGPRRAVGRRRAGRVSPGASGGCGRCRHGWRQPARCCLGWGWWIGCRAKAQPGRRRRGAPAGTPVRCAPGRHAVWGGAMRISLLLVSSFSGAMQGKFFGQVGCGLICWARRRCAPGWLRGTRMGVRPRRPRNSRDRCA